MNNPENKKWSTSEDFKKGDIIIDGVTLGKTTLAELRNRGVKIDKEDVTGKSTVYFAHLGDDDMAIGLISRYTNKDLVENKQLSSSAKQALLKLYNYVFSLVISLDMWNDCPLCSAIGIRPYNEDGDFDFDEISDLLEELGYIRIENVQNPDMSECMKFVHRVPNCNGDYVFVSLDTIQGLMYFSVNSASECTSYVTGETFTV